MKLVWVIFCQFQRFGDHLLDGGKRVHGLDRRSLNLGSAKPFQNQLDKFKTRLKIGRPKVTKSETFEGRRKPNMCTRTDFIFQKTEN